MNCFKIIFPCVFAIIFSGCASDHEKTMFQLHYSQYSKEVSNRIRSAKLYRRLETVMIVDAVFIDKGLREAWVNQQSRARRLSEKQKADMLARQMDMDRSFVEFIIAVYTSEDEWNDFAEEDTRWTVLLDSGANDSSSPVTIKKVKLENVIIRDHIPFDPRFRIFYRIDFPNNSLGSMPYNLTISSPLGAVVLDWARP
ncbi:hypothetical protein MNBD_NITROSPINAE02-792 [hydrothermal vent metagenome]|uniref:Lipoprotein n=1 Tax=hydrothermal vent metagenome TaxID=652676 RepID=A0A3B1BTR9_9ZZZZ